MLEFPRWKYILCALVVFFSALYALPNVFPQDPALQIAAQGGPIDDALATKVRGLLEAQ
jgi:preprotein translocase subunit SecD